MEDDEGRLKVLRLHHLSDSKLLLKIFKHGDLGDVVRWQRVRGAKWVGEVACNPKKVSKKWRQVAKNPELIEYILKNGGITRECRGYLWLKWINN